MISFLQQYLRINTALPNPDYESALRLFEAQAKLDGFLSERIILPSGNCVLVITYAGTDKNLPAVALNHHMDVVPACREDGWLEDPFGGVLANSMLIGRGTQDMKGVGIAHYAALRQLKYSLKSGQKLRRTIHLLMVPDEEVGGYQGTAELVDHPAFCELEIGYVLDEGLPSGSEHFLLLKIAERTPLQIRVISTGLAGHASQLLQVNCVHALIKFLHEITQFCDNQKQKTVSVEPGKLVSAHITSLKTNTYTLNVIPSLAEAMIDIRMPSQCTHEEIFELLDVLANKYALRYEVLATTYDRFNPIDCSSDLYQTLSTIIASNNLEARQLYFEATTDVRFYSARGIEGIGITPFTCMPNLHGVNESISVQDFELGQKIFFEFLRNFCV